MIWVGLECSPPQPRLPQIFRAIAWVAFPDISGSRLCIFQWASYAASTEKLHSLTNVVGPGADWCQSIAFFSKHSGTGSAFLLCTCQVAQHNSAGLDWLWLFKHTTILSHLPNAAEPVACYRGTVAGSAPDKASHGEFLWKALWWRMEGASWWGNQHRSKVLRFLLWVASVNTTLGLGQGVLKYWGDAGGRWQGLLLCQDALPGSVLYHTRTKIAARFLWPARGELCPAEPLGQGQSPWPPHTCSLCSPSLQQLLTMPQGPRKQTGTEWAGSRGRRRTRTAVNPRNAAALQCRCYPRGKHWDTNWEASHVFGRARRGLRDLISIIHIFLSSHLVLFFFLPALLEGSMYHSQQVFIFQL